MAGMFSSFGPTLVSIGLAPSEPSVALFPDGTWHMFYAAGVSIGEATSSDGATWTRVGGNPVFSPAPPATAAEIDAGTGAFDTGQVADPCLLPRLDPAGKVRQIPISYKRLMGGKYPQMDVAVVTGDTIVME